MSTDKNERLYKVSENGQFQSMSRSHLEKYLADHEYPDLGASDWTRTSMGIRLKNKHNQWIFIRKIDDK